MSRIQNWNDIIGGLMLIVIGVVFLFAGRNYAVGTPFQMGPGAFPTVMALIVMGFGALIILTGAARRDHIERPEWRPLIFISIAMVVFGVLIAFAGFLPAVVASTFICAMADTRFNLKTAALTSIGVFLACWLIFVIGLGLPIRLIGAS